MATRWSLYLYRIYVNLVRKLYLPSRTKSKHNFYKVIYTYKDVYLGTYTYKIGTYTDK
jgi:hypothetical protein